MDDFSLPKIVWKRIGSLLKFSYDTSGAVCLDSTCFAVGKDVDILTALLNTTVGNYMLANSPKTGTGDLIISVQALEPVFVPIFDAQTKVNIRKLLNAILTHISAGQSYDQQEQDLENIIYAFYGFSQKEREYIENTVYRDFR